MLPMLCLQKSTFDDINSLILDFQDCCLMWRTEIHNGNQTMTSHIIIYFCLRPLQNSPLENVATMSHILSVSC